MQTILYMYLSQALQKQKGFLILLALLMTTGCAIAQPIHGPQFDALVLNIADSRTGAPIHGLKVYLVDENHVTYTVKNTKDNRKANSNAPQYDSLVFWENLNPNLPKGRHLSPYPRKTFDGFEDTYVVSLPPIDISRMSKDEVPIFMAKVVDIDGENNGGTYPTRFFRLDYRDAVNLSQNGCHEKPQRGSYYFSISTVGGNRFLPTTFYLDQAAMPNGKFDPLTHMYRASYDTLRNVSGEDSLYALQTLVIRSWYSLMKIKEIEPSKPLYVGSEGIKKVISFGDYLDRNPEGKKDFRIWVQRIKNEVDQFEDYYDVYCYDENSDAYSRIPQLSDYPNVEYNAPGDPIRRTSTGIENGRIFQRYYVLSNMDWVLVNEVFQIPTPPVDPTVPISNCVNWVDARSHLAKVYFHTNADGGADVHHRFKYINVCRSSYKPLPFRSSHDPYFKASNSVASGDTGWVEFNARIAAHTTGLQATTHMAYVPTSDNPHAAVDIEFFVAHTEWVRAWHSNGTPAFVLVERGDGLANALVVDEEGYPLESGTYYSRDQKKIGNWTQYNRGGVKSYVKYGSVVHVNIHWPTDIKDEVLVSVYRRGKWTSQAASMVNGDRKFFLYERIDSVKVQSGLGVYRQAIDYDQLSNENWINVQLLYPDQIALPLGGTTVGINLTEYTFGIEWDRIYLHHHAELQKQDNAQLLQELLRRHPKVQAYMSPCNYCSMISLAHLSPMQRGQVLDELVRDSLLLSLNQAFVINRGAETFFSGHGSMRVNYNLSYAKVQAKIESYGFVYHGQINGAAGVYEMSWPSKIRGMAYILAMQAASKDPDISHISSSLYYEATTDEGMKDSMRD
jgi:hypothetical protein